MSESEFDFSESERDLTEWNEEKPVKMIDPELEQKFRAAVASKKEARKQLIDEADAVRKEYQVRHQQLIDELAAKFEPIKARTAELAEESGLIWHCFDSVVGREPYGGYSGEGCTPFSFYVPTNIHQWDEVSKELRLELFEFGVASYMKPGEWYSSALC